jgi:hypothetical protein
MWERLLHRILGIGEEGSSRIRLGAGVVYLTTAAFIAACAAIGGVCWALSRDPWFALAVTAIVAVLGIVFFLGTWRFADKHPDQAALGGTSWLRLRELQIESKGQPLMQVLPSSTDPLQQLPPSPSKSMLSGPEEE